MAAGDLLKLVLNSSLQQSIVQNVLYYKVITDATVGSNEDDLFNVFSATVIVGDWKGLISNEFNFDCMTIQKVFPTPIAAVQEFTVNIAGDLNTESLPAMDAVLMQKVNNLLGGVGRKGRVYVTGIPEADVEAGRILNTKRPAWLSLAQELGDELAAPNSGVYKPAWATRDKTTPFAINGLVEVDEVKLLPRIATQRRRRTPIRSFT